MMECVIKRFDELTVPQLYEILQLRSAVFVVEQNCVYQDIDGVDQESLHVCGYEDGKLQAYLRVFRNHTEDCAQIGRVISARRGIGDGRVILKEGIRAAELIPGNGKIVLEAQVYAIGFYEKEGFKVVSEPFDEDGIMHVKMEKAA